MIKDYTENTLVEKPAIELFSELGWQYQDGFHEFDNIGGSPLGRETKSEVVLKSKLRIALLKLNPDVSPDLIEDTINELTRDRSIMSPVEANREIYLLIKDGIRVSIQDPKGEEETIEKIKVIDWNNPENNDFLLVSQFWVTGEMYTRRADLVGFVNGLPLLFIELKAIHKSLKDAFDNNLRDYKDTIPHLFWYNSFIIISNGSQSKIGSLSASWDHFNEWKKINSEGEEGIISLDTIIRGTCKPGRFIDIVENYTLFSEETGGRVKLVAMNHQFLGVENAISAFEQIGRDKNQLGVFWHTQGSGKSYSMIFFAQKIFRKIHGNWTFVIVTDRKELDKQIYKNFARAGALSEEHIQAQNGEHLKELLLGDHRYIFTLIHKFHTKEGESYPTLSPRDDIIVITDEAHRSQYDTLAMNMRSALPNAGFIAFTGTPLIVGEEKTKQIFGDYVSIYNFKQSVDDKATVPIYYENRKPELQLTNENLNDDMERLLEDAELDEEQEKRLEREFAREYHIITRDDRLEEIAKDIVKHFMERGYKGKAMVVCIDKATAVRMYDRVQKHWIIRLDSLKEKIKSVSEIEGSDLKEEINFMEETEMAVVVSPSQNEISDMRSKGLDIAPHRKKMVTEDMGEKFKKPDDPFRLVFVCAMWMTGFDVPCCSTIYLDKPMRNLTLMQTIARANRVFGDKNNGLIVDYIGVFRNLQKALAIYGTGGGIDEGDKPTHDKSELVENLRKAISDITVYLNEKGVDIDKLLTSKSFELIKNIDDVVDAIIVNDDSKRKYLELEASVDKLYKAILPDPKAGEFTNRCKLFREITKIIHSLSEPVDISKIMKDVEGLLDRSVTTEGFKIKDTDHYVDLSELDFEALKDRFQKKHKNIETEKLKNLIDKKVKIMAKLNRIRMDFLLKFQQMIDEYNAGALNVEDFFKKLIDFAQELNEEDKRRIAENLTEEELTIFDLLTKPEPKLTKNQEIEVKKVAKELLESLKLGKLVLDWRKKQQSRAQVLVCIEDILDKLPAIYTPELYKEKCNIVYQHVYDSYPDKDKSVYIQ